MSGPRTGSAGVLTQKGDLQVVNSVLELDRLAAGADGRFLTARAANLQGMAWETKTRFVEMPPETTANISGFFGRRGSAAAAGQTRTGCCVVPPDFGAFVRYELWMIPRATQLGRSFRLDTQVGLDGGALISTTGTETVVTDIVTARHRRIQFPLAQPSGGLAPGRLTGVQFTNVDATSVDSLRFYLYYTTP